MTNNAIRSYLQRQSIRIAAIAILFAIGSAMMARADQSVSGDIVADTKWQRDSGTYIVVGDVTIRQGATLTVEPGVVVRFNARKRMVVEGSLVAVGDERQPIVFTKSAGNQNWSGITIEATGGTVFDGTMNRIGGSLFRHVKFHFADTALAVIQAGIVIDSSHFDTNNVSVDFCSSRGGLVRDNVFRGYNGTIVKLGGDCGNIRGDFRFTGNEFHDCQVFVTHPWLQHLNIAQNRFAGRASMEVMTSRLEPGVRSIHIHHNIFDVTSTDAILLLVDCWTTNDDWSVHHVLIEKNVFTGVRGSGIVLFERSANVFIMSNTFAFCHTGVTMEGFGLTRGRATDNTFLRNRYGLVLIVRARYTTWPAPQAVSFNTFAYQTDAAVLVSAEEIVDIVANDFIDEDSLTIVNQTKTAVNAAHNFWGAGATDAGIKRRNLDHDDDTSLGSVNFLPKEERGLFQGPIVPPKTGTLNPVPGGIVLHWARSPDPRVVGYRLWFDRDVNGRFKRSLDVTDSTSTIYGLDTATEIAITAFAQGAKGEQAQLEGRESWFVPVRVDQRVGAVVGASVHGQNRLLAYPNPSTGRVRMLVDVGRAATDFAAVFDATGKVVRSLAPFNASAGTSAIDWDGRDDRGELVAPAVYWIRAVVDRELVVRAVVIIR